MSIPSSDVRRANATVLPSRENFGAPSLNEGAGKVSWRRAPVSMETEYMLIGPAGVLLSAMARDFPSGDQSNASEVSIRSELPSDTLRTGPPREDTTKNPAPSPQHRKNAICRPSGD